jgi:hypothetical protein
MRSEKLRRAGLPLALMMVLLLGCDVTTSEASFIGGRREVICEGSFYACKGTSAGCELDESMYISGTFPSQRKILVTTPAGDYKIRLLFFLGNRLAPGTETEINWYEPGCADQYRWQLSKHSSAGDLFQQAGRDQVFEVEQAVMKYGQHPVEFWSDATCSYHLRVEVVEVRR